MIDLVCNSTDTISLKKSEPKIDSVLRIQGYKNPDAVRQVIREMALKAVNVFMEKATPEVSYRIASVDSVDREGMRLDSGIHLKSPIFTQYLSESTQVVAFALTVGDQIDNQTTEWMNEEKLVEALFLESAAWLGVENATKQFVTILRQWAMRHNLRISRRLGPGYSYPVNGKSIQWELHDQQPLFAMFGDADISIRLLESSAMLPKMSRSGLFGITPRQPASH